MAKAKQPAVLDDTDDDLDLGRTIAAKDDDADRSAISDDEDDIWDSADVEDDDVPASRKVDECPDCGGDKNQGDCTCGEEEPGNAVEERTDAIADLLAKPIGQILSAIALQGVSAKMKKKPLSAMSNEWLNGTFARLSGLESQNPTATEGPQWRMDIALIKAAASAREMILDSIEPEAPELAAGVEPVATSIRKGQLRHNDTDAPILGAIVEIALKEISPDPTQARDEGADEDLAPSIAANGVLKPIELRVHPDQPAVMHQSTAKYMIVDGERRFRGSLKAGLKVIPATITDQAENEGDRLARQLLSNEGKRLRPMEEARTFKRIMADKGWNIQQLAEHLGRSKSTVSDRLSMVDVPAEFIKYFEEGILTAAAAPILRPLGTLPDKARKRVVESILNNGDFGYLANQARDDGKAMQLRDVEQEVSGALHDELCEIDPKQGADYKGKVVSVGKTDYALDVAAYEAAVKQAEANPARKKAAPTPAEVKAQAADRKRQAAGREARAKEKRARDLKQRLHEARFSAVAAKMPSAIDGKLALILIDIILDPIAFALTASALAAMGVPPMPNKGGAFDAERRRVFKHAESLDAKGRTRLLLQLAVWSDKPSHRGLDDHVALIAPIIGVDLRKVKAPETLNDLADRAETGRRPAARKKKGRK